MSRLTIAAMAAACLLGGCKKAAPVVSAAGPVPVGVTAQAGRLSLQVPPDAVQEKPASEMRAGQWRIPHAAGDATDASLVVFYFGAGQGGTPEQNIQRWCAQFTDEKGQPSCDQSAPVRSTVNGAKVTRVAYRGRYQTQDMRTGEAIDAPHQALLAAVVETAVGSFFIKLEGPEKTVLGEQPFFEARLLPSVKAN